MGVIRSSIKCLPSKSLRNRLADYVESAAAREKAEAEANKAKLAALERSLGISSDPSPGSAEASGSKRKQDIDLAEIAMKKKKFEDTEYLEQSREINDNVRSAVSAGRCLQELLKGDHSLIITTMGDHH